MGMHNVRSLHYFFKSLYNYFVRNLQKKKKLFLRRMIRVIKLWIATHELNISNEMSLIFLSLIESLNDSFNVLLLL